MFLSTIVPSTMLNVNKNLNTQPYNFSVPYNFVRGRNIIININPANIEQGGPYNYNFLTNALTPGGQVSRLNVLIPDDVTEYAVTMEAILNYDQANNHSWFGYTIYIVFDTVNNIITFTPQSFRVISGANIPNLDDQFTSPVLITVSTIL